MLKPKKSLVLRHKEELKQANLGRPSVLIQHYEEDLERANVSPRSFLVQHHEEELDRANVSSGPFLVQHYEEELERANVSSGPFLVQHYEEELDRANVSSAPFLVQHHEEELDRANVSSGSFLVQHHEEELERANVSPRFFIVQRHEEELERAYVSQNKTEDNPGQLTLLQREINHLKDQNAKLRFQTEITQLKSSLKLKEKQIAELKKSLNIKLQELTTFRKQMYKLSTTIEEKNANIKSLEEVTNSQKKEIEELRLNKAENDIQLKNTRQACIQHFNSRVDRQFSEKYSHIITKAQKMYNLNGHLDKIQYCPAMLYMNSVQVPESSDLSINELDDEPLAKRLKAPPPSTMRDLNITIKSLQALVLNLESRHSENYYLWRNVLWALNKCGLENKYDTLEIADQFSKRSLKYKNFEDVKKTFESSDGTMSLQYLIDASKIYEEGLYNMGEYLSTVMPSTYLPFTLTQVDFRDHKKIGLIVKCSNVSYVLYIIPHLFVLTDQKGMSLGVLKKKIKSNSSILQSLCPSMRDGFTVTLKDDYEFKSLKKPHTLILNNPLDAENASITFPNGQRGRRKVELQRIYKALRKETMQFLSRKSGKIFADDSNDFIDIGNESSSSVRDDVKLVQALFAAKPSIKTRYCSDSGKTIYYCQPQTNLWEIISEKKFDVHMQASFTNTAELNLTRAELTYVQKKSSIANLRNYILSEIEVTHFAKSLNSKLHLFITDNKTIDTSSTPPIIRHIEIEDLAKTTCGWSYDYDLAATQKEAVQTYFNTMFPNQSERQWFLSFIAKFLNGKRTFEPFLVLMDEQEGKTGKTTLIKLLKAVFGSHCIANSKIVTEGKPRDFNELCCLDKKRLLLANGLQKTDTLNIGFIKIITGDSDYHIKQVNKFFRTEFDFEVQAGLVIVANEDSMPKFNKKDTKFLDRMVVCPLRSRFVTEQEFQDISWTRNNNIRVADDSLELQFSEWRSATLDLLLEYCNQPISTIPDSMRVCKKRVCDMNFDYTDWLNRYLCRSKTAKEFISATQIMQKILQSETELPHPREMQRLKAAMAEWATRHGYKYKERHVYANQKRVRRETKSVIINVTIDNDIVEG